MTRKLSRLLEQVREGHTEFVEIERLLEQIDLLQADVRAASDVIGRLSIWLPHVQDNPSGTPKEFQLATSKLIQLAIRGIDDLFPNALGLEGEIISEGFRFPQLEDAVRWLLENNLATESEIASMTNRQKLEAFSAPGINSRKTLEKLRQTIAESIQAGESLQEFRRRLDPEIELLKHEEETIYRTKTKQSYVEGLERTLDAPGVAERFPFVYYTATDDNRVRDHHWDLDGKVAEKGSSLYKVMMAVLREWNCRCSVIPITREEAERRGINSLSDLPNEFQQEFDVSLVI